MIYATAVIILAMVATLKGPEATPKGSPYERIDAVTLTASPYSCDPALTALFTPARPELGRYEACTTDQPIEGEAEALEALDAFGAAGSYNRAALRRLYGGARVRVQRSWTATASEFVSTTRLSPYPDASLTHLMPGTMEIRWRLDR